ncbi:MAG: hypothetical protein FJ145_03610 [Deltaproteobacteria bacterium]|nr:hypothetical protein [Deltaproteobacteria bacterium]
MAYDDDDIKREIKRQRIKKDRAPMKERKEAEAKRRLGSDILLLITRIDDRAFFLRQLETLTARYGLHIGETEKLNALRIYDQYRKRKR